MQEKVNQNQEEVTEDKEKTAESAQNTASDAEASAKESAANEQESAEEATAEKEDPLVAKEEELKATKEKYLRLYSDFENFRKRTQKEKAELWTTVQANFVLDLLPAFDDYERAEKAYQENKDDKQFSSGLQMVFKNLKKALKDKGVEPIEAIGKDFDTDLHEAFTKIPAPEKKLKGKVVDEVEKGYKLKDKVIRHTKVVIGE